MKFSDYVVHGKVYHVHNSESRSDDSWPSYGESKMAGNQFKCALAKKFEKWRSFGGKISREREIIDSMFEL